VEQAQALGKIQGKILNPTLDSAFYILSALN
jgi:hypothetical protein